MKKILLLFSLLLFICHYNFVDANKKSSYEQATIELKNAKTNETNAQFEYIKNSSETNKQNYEAAKTRSQEAQKNFDKEHNKFCASSGSCLEKPSFSFPVSSVTPGPTFSGGKGTSFKERIDWFLGNIIQKLIVAIGFFAVFIMTIGGGYMVLNSGKDELLNKGKTIFMSGIWAVVIALSSYIIVSIIKFLIYN